MNITHVIASATPGGMESHVSSLCNALSETHPISVIAPRWHAAAFAPAVNVIPFDDLLASRYNPVTLFKLHRLLKTLSPDIIHVHGSKAAQMVALPFFKTYTRIATVHGIKKRTRLFRPFDHLIAVSRKVAESLVPYPCTVIYNGIRAPGTPPPPCASTPPVVLAIGRLAPVKGFDNLIKAWPRVKNANLQIAGDGPEREHLEALIKQRNLQHRVQLLGHRDDIHDLLNACDLLVISSHREGASLVFAEALARNRPVVSTDCGLMSELMPPTLLAPPNAPEALAEKINAALTDLPAYSAQLTPLYDLCRRDMTIQTMTAKTEAVYKGATPNENTI